MVCPRLHVYAYLMSSIRIIFLLFTIHIVRSKITVLSHLYREIWHTAPANVPIRLIPRIGSLDMAK